MKTKQIFLTIAIVFASCYINAQNKFDFLIIEYSTLDNKVTVSVNGKEFLKERIDFEKHDKSGYNANPMLEKVSDYQDLGWELMNFDTEIGGSSSQNYSGNSSEIYFAYMRKKKEY